MKLVVDTNILFSFFKRESTTRTLILRNPFELVSPQVALKELQKYSTKIVLKSHINNDELNDLFMLLKEHIKFFTCFTLSR